jgi:hypothetical protein
LVFQDLLLPPMDWARRHFGGVDLGDVRRNHRAVKIARAMVDNPAASIPLQMGNTHQAKAAYRFFDTPDAVTFDALASGHWQQTRHEMADLPVTLLVQDTTEIDYTAHRSTQGLEQIGDGRGRGMLLHSVLSLDPHEQGRVQGLAWQDLSYRQTVDKTETRTERQHRTERESAVWAKAVKACGRPAAGRRYVHVCDCGADDFGFYDACRRGGCDFVNRIYQQRRAALGHDAITQQGLLIDLARTLTPLGGKTLELRSRKGVCKKIKRPGERRAKKRRQDVRARRAKLLVAAGAVSVFAPWLGNDDALPLRLWVVRVWEVDAPPGIEPIEWVLLCSMPVTDLSDALQMARWYSYRWLIEEYHKCLKTGCGVEGRQLEHADRLEAMLGIMVVVAARLLALKQQALKSPQARAVEQVGELQVRLLKAQRNLPTPTGDMTVYQFWREVAKLGGFLGRKSDGEPGWQTLWRGWQQLQTMVRGAQLLLAETEPKRSG